MNLNKLLEDHQTGQDETQLQSFVLGGRTPWGTYKQALRELYKRVRGLRQAQTDLDLLKLDIREQEELQIGLSVSSIEESRLKIGLRQLYGNLEEAERCMADLKREAAIFYREAIKLKESIGEVDDVRRVELDREEWKHWHLKRGMLDKMTTGRLSEVVLNNLYSITAEERAEWLKCLGQNPSEFLERGELGKVALPPPSEDDVKLLEEEISDDTDDES